MDKNDKSKLLYLFKTHAHGIENARLKTTFTWMLWDVKEPSSAQERNFRLMVEELIQEGEPICSHPDYGYWYASSISDANPAVADTQSRINKLYERKNKLETNLIAKYGGQIGMFQ